MLIGFKTCVKINILFFCLTFKYKCVYKIIYLEICQLLKKLNGVNTFLTNLPTHNCSKANVRNLTDYESLLNFSIRIVVYNFFRLDKTYNNFESCLWLKIVFILFVIFLMIYPSNTILKYNVMVFLFVYEVSIDLNLKNM